MTPDHELTTLDAIKSSGLCMTSTTFVHELKAVDDINNYLLWLT